MAVSRQMTERMEQSSWIRKMFEDAARAKRQFGEDAILDLSLGNPTAAPPREWLAALEAAAADDGPDVHRYMNNAGFPAVRAAVAAAAAAEYGVPVTADNVVMCCGAAGGLNVLLKSLLDRGDEVVAVAPYFPEYESYVDNQGGVLRLAESDADFQPDPDRIAAAVTDRTRAILICSPNNPTGVVYSRASLERLAEVAGDAGRRLGRPVYVIADDIYRHVAYDGVEVASMPAIYPNTIVVTSFSKSMGVAGERIGYVLIPPAAADAAALVEACTTATRILGFVNAPALMQRVIARCPEARIDLTPYRRNRDVLHAALTTAGFTQSKPQGAFYLFPRCPGGDDLAAWAALRDKGVFVVPGVGFKRPGHLRLAYCVRHETCVRAAEIIARGV